MVERAFWKALIEDALQRRSVVWISGVRRAGKTFLCRSLPDAEYLDCELPSVRRILEDPEAFLRGVRGKRVVLDEVHRLPNPSELLKIAADHFSDVRIIATGASTLQASSRFSDTLTGRKTEVWLSPMLASDMVAFGMTDLKHRLLHGGLPPFFLAETIPERDYQEWTDSFWAKDILELFHLERRHGFLRLMELLMVNSGGIFEATSYAHPCEISRGTVTNYLAILEAAWAVHVVRPFSRRRPTEIVSAPRVYAFDTGFVCNARGWTSLRPDDLGILWEHYVLNEIMGRLQRRDVRYWRTKTGYEVDFVVPLKTNGVAAIECKWSPEAFDPAGLKAFRALHPEGPTWCVSPKVERPYRRTFGGRLEVEFVGLEGLIRGLTSSN